MNRPVQAASTTEKMHLKNEKKNNGQKMGIVIQEL